MSVPDPVFIDVCVGCKKTKEVYYKVYDTKNAKKEITKIISNKFYLCKNIKCWAYAGTIKGLIHERSLAMYNHETTLLRQENLR